MTRQTPPPTRYVSWADSGGYATAARRYVQALIRSGTPIAWDPLVPTRDGWIAAESTEQAIDYVTANDVAGIDATLVTDSVHRSIGAQLQTVHLVPELWAQHIDDRLPACGMTVWETDRLPNGWVDLFDVVERVIVPSRFNAEVFAESGARCPIDIVPHVTAPSPEPATAREEHDFRTRHSIPADHLIVYAIEAWNPRKDLTRTIRAALRAMAGHDGATIVVKTDEFGMRSGTDPTRESCANQIARLVGGSDHDGHVVVITGERPGRELEVLHDIGDCYVSLTHGEGWGIGIMEAAAAGNPVVTTGWGAPVDYLGDDWPMFVHCDLVPVLHAGAPTSYSPDQRWASADVDHAAELIRRVLDDPSSARTAVEPMTRDLRERYSEAAVGRVLNDVLAGAVAG